MVAQVLQGLPSAHGTAAGLARQGQEGGQHAAGRMARHAVHHARHGLSGQIALDLGQHFRIKADVIAGAGERKHDLCIVFSISSHGRNGQSPCKHSANDTILHDLTSGYGVVAVGRRAPATGRQAIPANPQ
jgi:hypothetical protein